MKASNGPLVLVITAAIIAAICWCTITALTAPSRAIASAIVLVAVAIAFIWFAQTNRHAIARGIISVGATAFAAPLAAAQALVNDTLLLVFDTEGPTALQFEEWDALIGLGWTMCGVGAGFMVVCLIVGGLLHRTPRGDGGTGAAG